MGKATADAIVDLDPDEEERTPRSEAWLIFVALLCTALVPSFSKTYGDFTPDPVFNQLLWSVLYLIAFVRIRTLVPNVRTLIAKSAWLWVFGLLMLISVLWSVNPFVTIKESMEMIGTMIIGAYIVARFPLRRFLNILSVVFGAIATLSLLLIFASPGRGRMDWGSGAWSGLFQEKNLLGAAMAFAIFSIGFSLPSARGKRRLRMLATLILCILLLVGSNSVTAATDLAIVLLLAGAVLLCRSERYGATARIVVAAAAAVALVLYTMYGFDPNALFAMFGRSSTLTGRTDFWPFLYQAIGDRPLLGYGYDAFFTAPISVDYLSYYVVGSGGWTPYHAHNSFLQILLNAGYVGLALCIVQLLVGFRRSIMFISRKDGQGGAEALWPFAVLLYLVVGSYTESYLGGFNSMESVLFVAAYLYPVRSALIGSRNESAADPTSSLEARPYAYRQTTARF